MYSNQRRLYQKIQPSRRVIQASCGMFSARARKRSSLSRTASSARCSSARPSPVRVRARLKASPKPMMNAQVTA